MIWFWIALYVLGAWWTAYLLGRVAADEGGELSAFEIVGTVLWPILLFGTILLLPVMSGLKHDERHGKPSAPEK